jgi:hypothetical protein
MRHATSVIMPKIGIAHADPVPLNSTLDRPRLKVVASAAIRRLTSGQFMRIPNLYLPTVCPIHAAATIKLRHDRCGNSLDFISAKVQTEFD